MSILVIEVLSEGLIFGADRNITGVYGDGTTAQIDLYPKVMKWPHNNTLFGYVGAAQMGGVPMHEWLSTLDDDFQDLSNLEEMANKSHDRVQAQRDKDDSERNPEPLAIHLGGFARKDNHWVPHVWHIGNIYKLGQYGYLDFRHEFYCTEAFWANDMIKQIDPSEIRRFLKVIAKQFQPYWIHQGLDLLTFNALQDAMRAAFKLLCERHPV